MNYPVSTFRALSSAFHHDAASPEVDVLAADLAAWVGSSRYPLCIGLVRKDAVRKFYGLVYLLNGYGVTLRQRHREGGEGVFVYAERQEYALSEFEGAAVNERRTPDYAPVYAQAA